MSDQVLPMATDTEQNTKPVSQLRNQFNLKPLDSKFDFVDKIKAPYEAPKLLQNPNSLQE